MTAKPPKYVFRVECGEQVDVLGEPLDEQQRCPRCIVHRYVLAPTQPPAPKRKRRRKVK